MKKTLLIFFLFSFTILSAQNVGVNIMNPEFTFDVRSTNNSDPGQFNLSNLDKSKYLRFFSGSDAYPDPSVSWAPGRDFLFATYNDATFDFTEHMRINYLGNVGIGITNPEAQLDLKGGDWNLDAGNPGDLRIGNASTSLRIGVATGGGGAGISRIYSTSHLILGTADEQHMQIDTEGETGFGTTNPNQKVHINGKLKIGDDAKAPTEGTMRYNSVKKSFEGYDGTKWINLGGSSPYGVEGTFNLPNSEEDLWVIGKGLGIRADGNIIATRSTGEKLTGYDNYFFPPEPIFEDVIYMRLFEKNNSSEWIEVAALDSHEMETDLDFGRDFDVTSNRFLIGDPLNKRVLEYSLSSGTWTLTNTFTSPSPTAYIYDSGDNLAATLSGPGEAVGDGFGSDVDMSSDRAIVGAPYNNVGAASNSGSATVFNKFNGNWSTNSTYYSENGTDDDNFGFYVNIEDDHFCVRDNVEGIYNYAVEGGYWVLKETINGQGVGYTVGTSKYYSYDKMVFQNASTEDAKAHFLTAFDRDENNFFVPTSNLLIGDSKIESFDVTDSAVYAMDKNDNIFIFEY